MPGLCGVRRLHDEKRLCAAIITTKPNAFFAGYHDRQVCTLEDDELDAWMTASGPEEALRLLQPPDVDAWEVVPVDDRIFGRGRPELEDLVPIGEPERWEGH